MWNDYENDTLIHQHKMAKIYKKRYQRASDLNNTLYSFFGLIAVLTSTIASTISWGTELDEGKRFILTAITTTSAISAAIQNFYNFQENSSKLTNTAKQYSRLQNNIESVGNTNPNSREINSKDFFKENQTKFDDLSDNRQELSNWLIKCCYTKKEDKISYLEEKHKKYNDNDNDNDNNDNNDIDV